MKTSRFELKGLGTWAVIGAICVASFAVQPSTAFGEAKVSTAQRDEAKKYFIEGRESFDAGDYRKAIAQFEKAYEIVNSREILYNIGRCHEELGENEEAIEYYEMYLRLYPTASDADDLRYRIGVLRKQEEEKPQEEAVEPESVETYEEEVEEDEEFIWWKGIHLGADIGVAWSLGKTVDAVAFPLEIFGAYPVWKWLLVEIAFAYGRYHDEPRSDLSHLTVIHQVGLLAGARGDWSVAEDWAIFGRLGLAIMWVKFRGDHTIPWLHGRVSAGATYRVLERFHLLAALLVGVGPLFGGEPLNTNLEDPGVETELGFQIGAEFVF